MIENASFTTPLTVSQLNRRVRETLESGFPLCWVAGEISNLTLAASGHCYFSLKDESAQVRCVMFRSRVQLLGRQLRNGMRVEARVLVSLYEARGDFQLNVETLREAGKGNLHAEFLRLKEQLEREGCFDPAHKRPLPRFPLHLGIVTSLQAAALRDVLSTLRRRAPQIEVLIAPTPVQGDGAGTQIARAITALSAVPGLDALIVCRGGGSLEDLWAFNDPAVVYALRACPLPVVSGVGHETDFTLCDFAADCRAPTPTAAAELLAPDRAALLKQLRALQRTLTRRTQAAVEQRGQHLDWLARRLLHPRERLQRRQRELDHLLIRLQGAHSRMLHRHKHHVDQVEGRLLRARPQSERMGLQLQRLEQRLHTSQRSRLLDRKARLEQLDASLRHLNPDRVLARGYALVRDAQGNLVRSATSVEPGDPISVYLARGRVEAEVLTTEGSAQ